MSLSLGILAHNCAAYIEQLLRAGREFADEIVVGVDSSSTDSTEEICRAYADKLFRLEPIGTSERALAWLNDQCRGDWILRLDHDELPSGGLVAALPRLMADRDYTHYWLPRRWVIGSDGSRWIAEPPWWPDWQLRFFRNIRSLVSFPGHLHSDYSVLGAGGRFCEGSIYHFDLVYHSEERRRAKIAQYERISPGNSMAHYYFPVETVVTLPLSAHDPPWRGRPAAAGRARHAAPGPVGVKYVSLAQMRQAERKGCSYPPDLFRATLESMHCPAEMRAGLSCPAELRLRNESHLEWPGPGLGAPEIRVAYHWLRSTGEVQVFDGLRTPLPLTVRPGEAIGLIAEVLAPWRPGQYTLRWDLVIEHVSWFSTRGWTGPEVRVQVNPGPKDPPELERIADCLDLSYRIPGWIRGEEAKTLALISHSLPEAATLVEVGSFLGSGTLLLAGPRKIRGSGKVHCIDPFDCSGDAFSMPVYQQILAGIGGGSLRAHFDKNIQSAGLDEWVEVHQGRAAEIAARWKEPVDLLFLDGDQSRTGAREAYTAWSPFLKPGGLIAVHNTEPREYAPDHDGNRLLALEEIVAPGYADVRLVGATTLARKVAFPGGGRGGE